MCGSNIIQINEVVYTLPGRNSTTGIITDNGEKLKRQPHLVHNDDYVPNVCLCTECKWNTPNERGITQVSKWLFPFVLCPSNTTLALSLFLFPSLRHNTKQCARRTKKEIGTNLKGKQTWAGLRALTRLMRLRALWVRIPLLLVFSISDPSVDPVSEPSSDVRFFTKET